MCGFLIPGIPYHFLILHFREKEVLWKWKKNKGTTRINFSETLCLGCHAWLLIGPWRQGYVYGETMQWLSQNKGCNVDAPGAENKGIHSAMYPELTVQRGVVPAVIYPILIRFTGRFGSGWRSHHFFFFFCSGSGWHYFFFLQRLGSVFDLAVRVLEYPNFFKNAQNIASSDEI